MDEQQVSGADEPEASQDARQGRPTNPLMRRIAAGVCAIEAVVLLGFCGFYLWEIAQGQSNDTGRAVMSTLLIAVFAVALGFLARAWVRGAGWPNTPTVVWNVLLVPVSWGLLTGGQALVGALVAVVAVVGIAAAALAGEPPEAAA